MQVLLWTPKWKYPSGFGSFDLQLWLSSFFFIYSGSAVNYCTVDKAVTVVQTAVKVHHLMSQFVSRNRPATKL